MTAIESRPEPRQAKPRQAQPRQAKPRAPRGARVVGYLIAVAINMAFVWLVNVAPGWRWLPFLSDDFSRVVGLMTLSFLISVVVNLVYVALDPPWLKRLGDALTVAVAFVVTLQLFLIFPFDFGPQWAEWETPFRLLLGIGCVGVAIGVIVNLVMLVRLLATGVQER